MFLLLSLLSVVCAVVPMLTFLMIVWFLDRHDREPLWLVILTFVWGACGAVGFAILGNQSFVSVLTTVFGSQVADTISAPIVAPLVEEPMKALVLFVVMFSRHFDNATDGFVYGAAAGLGFGMTENFFYFVNVAASGDLAMWVQTVVIRTFFSALMHACATSCVGAMLGFARFRGAGWKGAALPIGFGLAVGMHALWNGMITIGILTDNVGFVFANLALFMLEFGVLFVVFQISLWEERGTIRRELADEVEQNLLPLAHATAVGSWWNRSKTDWLPQGVPHRPYVKALTMLAVRKHQSRNTTHPFYSEDVVRLRGEVHGLRALAT